MWNDSHLSNTPSEFRSFMTLAPVSGCLLAANEIVSQGKHIYSRFKDVSSPGQMFCVNLLSSNMWLQRKDLS